MRPFCSALMTPNLYPELIPMNGPLPCSVPQTTGGDNFTRPSGPGWSRSLPKYSISPTMIVRSCDACIPQAILLSQQLGRNYRLHFLLTIKSRRIWDDLHVLSLSLLLCITICPRNLTATGPSFLYAARGWLRGARGGEGGTELS